MGKKFKRQPMPKWIWQLHPKILNCQQKRFLSYVWWCGDRGCRDWNWAIMKRFRKSRATVKRWIKHLEDLHLIFINFPHTKHRTIYRRPYFSMVVWIAQGRAVKSGPQGSKMSHINTAQQGYSYKASYNPTACKAETAKRRADGSFLSSDAGRLCGSEGGPPDIEKVEAEAADIRTRTALRNAAKLRETLGEKQAADIDNAE